MNVYRFTGNVYNSADSQKGEIMRTIILSLIMMLISFPALAVKSSPVDTGRATATLISSHDSILPGQKFYIALQTKLDRNWHTYWQNPGDSGEPVYIDWALPIGIEAGVINWPSPKVIQTGPIVNYGFEGSPIFPVQFSVGKDVEPGSIVTITANFSYLVCKDICIPENGSANLSIAIGPSIEDMLQKTKIDFALNKVPKKGDIESTVELKGETIKVGFKNFSLGNISELYFFPYENGYFKNISRKSSRNNNDRLVLELIPDLRRKEIFPSNVRGVLTYKINGIPNSEVIDLDTSKLKLKEKKLLKKTPTNLSFVSALFGAFIGGIILNFMPCVFPIISMKAFSIAKLVSEKKSAIKRDALLYSAGIMTTFLVFAIVILLLKLGGAEIGWGFHLQSPKVVSVLSIILFLAGLSLLGVFETGSVFQNFSSRVMQKYKMTNSFFTGAFAVVVATPCTAPLMAGALGYAFVSTGLITITVLLSLGAGFASPFLLLACFPNIITKLPKPGVWMKYFKEALSFPMFAASIWLLWVLDQQVGPDGVAKVLVSFLFFVIAIWFVKNNISARKLLAPIFLIIALILPLYGDYNAEDNNTLYGSYEEEWSSERVLDLNNEGKRVFVNFTAAWCVTCKYNEKVVLNDPRVKKLFKDTDTTLLVADWTNKNSKITKELRAHGRAGVPLYLVYSDTLITPVILPQTLSYNVIKNAIVK